MLLVLRLSCRLFRLLLLLVLRLLLDNMTLVNNSWRLLMHYRLLTVGSYHNRL